MSRSSRAESHLYIDRDWRALFRPSVATGVVMAAGGVAAVLILLFVGGTAITGHRPFSLPIGPQPEKVETASAERVAAITKRPSKAKSEVTLAIGPSVPAAEGAAAKGEPGAAGAAADDPAGFWATDVVGADVILNPETGVPSLTGRFPIEVGGGGGGSPSSPGTSSSTPTTGPPTTAPPAVPVPEPTTTLPPVTIPEPTEPIPTLPPETVPEVTLPEVTLPEVTLPEVTLPEVTLPEVTIPEVTIPPILPLF